MGLRENLSRKYVDKKFDEAISFASYGIEGVVDNYTALVAIDTSGWTGKHIYIVSYDEPEHENGLYMWETGSWTFLHNLSLQKASEVPNDSSVTGVSVKDALETLESEDLTFLKFDGSRKMSGDLDMDDHSILNLKDSSISFKGGGALTRLDYLDSIVKKHTQNTDQKLDEGGVNEIGANEITKKLLVDVEYYVDPVNGDDTNPGTEVEPFKTIQHGIDITPKNMNGHYIWFYLQDGYYDEHVQVYDFFNGGMIGFESISYDTTKCLVNSIFIMSDTNVNIGGIGFKTDDTAIYIYDGHLDIWDCGFCSTVEYAWGMSLNGCFCSIGTCSDLTIPDTYKVEYGLSIRGGTQVILKDSSKFGDTFVLTSWGLPEGIIKEEGNLNLYNRKILNIKDPTDPKDAANKEYVDTQVSGLGGDMLKSIYDTDEDGIVDKSENVDDGVGNSSSASQVKEAVDKKHDAVTVLAVPLTLSGQEITFNYDINQFKTGGSDLQIKESGIDHDLLKNFVSNEHIDWTNASQDFKTTGIVTIDTPTALALIIGDGTDCVNFQIKFNGYSQQGYITWNEDTGKFNMTCGLEADCIEALAHMHTDELLEHTENAGVTIDGVLIKDGEIDTDLLAKKHAQNKDTKLDEGGGNEISASQLKADSNKLGGIESGATTDQIASEVSFTPVGNIEATEVQSAIEEIDSEKLALAGGIMTGDLSMLANKITSNSVLFLHAPDEIYLYIASQTGADRVLFIGEDELVLGTAVDLKLAPNRTVDGRDVSVDGTKLDTIENSAVALATVKGDTDIADAISKKHTQDVNRNLKSFDNTDLVTGVLTVTHNLGEKYVEVQIYDNNDKLVNPDDIILTDTNSLNVDLTSYGTIEGTWYCIVKR